MRANREAMLIGGRRPSTDYRGYISLPARAVTKPPVNSPWIRCVWDDWGSLRRSKSPRWSSVFSRTWGCRGSRRLARRRAELFQAAWFSKADWFLPESMVRLAGVPARGVGKVGRCEAQIPGENSGTW